MDNHDNGWFGYSCDICIEQKHMGANKSTTFRKCQFCHKDVCERHQARIRDLEFEIMSKLDKKPTWRDQMWLCPNCAVVFQAEYETTIGQKVDELVKLHKELLKKWKQATE